MISLRSGAILFLPRAYCPPSSAETGATIARNPPATTNAAVKIRAITIHLFQSLVKATTTKHSFSSLIRLRSFNCSLRLSPFRYPSRWVVGQVWGVEDKQKYLLQSPSCIHSAELRNARFLTGCNSLERKSIKAAHQHEIRLAQRIPQCQASTARPNTLLDETGSKTASVF